jgi:hypothetical protein
MKAFVRIALAVLVLGVMSDTAAAQMVGIPASFAPAGMGPSIAVFFGRGLNENSGKANSLGGEIVYGAEQFMVGGQVGYADFSGDGAAKQINFGGKAGYALPLPETTPVNLMVVAGANYWSDGDADFNSLYVPAGVSLSFDVPSESVAVTPWVAPQFRYVRFSSGGFSDSNSDFGVSGGVRVDFDMFGIDLMGDYDNASEGFTVGAGAHVNIPTGN